MSRPVLFSNFNETYFNFLNFIKKHMENDKKFNLFYSKNLIIKQTNIKLIIRTWYNRITRNYYDKIMNQDFDFFLNKSYEEDVVKDNTSGESPMLLIQYISNFKTLFPSLEESIKTEFITYMIKLTHLSFLYFKE
jgi:hypothetical protein